MGIEDIVVPGKGEDKDDTDFNEELEMRIRLLTVGKHWWIKECREKAEALAKDEKKDLKKEGRKEAKKLCEERNKKFNEGVINKVNKIINSPEEMVWLDN